MSYIDWFDQLNTGLEDVDNQHKKLVSLLNDLYDSLRQGTSRTLIDKILNELVQYAMYHFETEEKYMSEYNYPGFLSHKETHEKFKEMIREFMEKELKEKKISVELLIFLKDWLVKHILTVDKKFATFVLKESTKNL